MIQFIKFATVDPEGFTLIRLDQISSIGPTSDPEECIIVTFHEEYRVRGSMEYFSDFMGGVVGSELTAVSETGGSHGN